MPATMWKANAVETAEGKLAASVRMHRMAGERGYSCMPKLSSIDARWYAEINRYVGPGGIMDFNIKLGTGDSPTEAAADGYTKTLPDDLALRAVCLEARVDAAMLQKERIWDKLSATLDEITRTLPLVKLAPVAMPADPGEDDDL